MDDISNGRPVAVAGFVMLFPVDSVNAMVWGWSRPHISQKVFKRITPPLADPDAFGSNADVTTLIAI